MGNTFAFFALLIWPLVSAFFLLTSEPHKAIVKCSLGSLLLLPVGVAINLNLLPILNKQTIPIISLYLLSLFFAKIKFKHLTKCKISNLLFIVFIFSHFVTLAANQEPVIAGPRYIPGYTLHSTISLILLNFLSMGFFFLGRHHFQKFEHQKYLFQAIIISALAYTCLILFELKMSPRLHSDLYGFFPHSFSQMKRAGGYRPVVFLGHGLLVSFFLASAVLSASAFWKNKWKIKSPILNFSKGKISSLYLILILLLSKSIAPFLYGIFSTVCAMFMSIKRVALIALVLSGMTLLYPIIKINHLLPEQQIISLAEQLTNSERALSISVRFKNENELLNKVKEKLYSGWGGWGRSRIYGTYGDESITDGYWILKLGESGLIGFYSLFGLIFLSVYKAKIAIKSPIDESEKRLLVMHALLVSLILIDQIPNSSLESAFWWLVIGALMGRSEYIIKENKRTIRKSRSIKTFT